MIVRRFFEERLAQASYLIGCERTGHAIVVDPNVDLGQYIEAAKDAGLSIAHVTETHIHADFLSGARALAARTGAELNLSREGGSETGYALPGDSDVRWIGEGSSIEAGTVRLDVLHTPGHTPEHLTFLVVDLANGSSPLAALTGDFVFVGDVGRPDLLERVANARGSFERGARDLHASIARFLKLPDYVQIWPGHGAGSACGRQLSAVPSSSLGYERLYNWAMQPQSVDAFVAEIIQGQPDVPSYFGEMKRRNRIGGGHGLETEPPQMPAAEVERVIESGALVVDIRSPRRFAAEHRRGSVNVPLQRGFTTWAGSVLPYDKDIFIIGGSDAAQRDAFRELQLIGYDRVAGFFGTDALREVEGGPAGAATRRIGVDDLNRLRQAGDALLLDVRGTGEWEAGHIPGARHVPLSDLHEIAPTLPRDRPVIVHCESGARSSIAASVLEREGVPDVLDFHEGYSAWAKAAE